MSLQQVSGELGFYFGGVASSSLEQTNIGRLPFAQLICNPAPVQCKQNSIRRSHEYLMFIFLRVSFDLDFEWNPTPFNFIIPRFFYILKIRAWFKIWNTGQLCSQETQRLLEIFYWEGMFHLSKCHLAKTCVWESVVNMFVAIRCEAIFHVSLLSWHGYQETP